MVLSLRHLRPHVQATLLLIGVLIVSYLLPHVPEYSLARLATTTTELQDGTLNGRLITWAEGWQALADRPLLGIGSGAFREAVESGRVAHNVFLSIGVEVGMPGLLLFLAILALCGYLALLQALRGNLLWVVLLTTWLAGAMALTWEPRKQTWLIMTWIIAAYYLTLSDSSPEESSETIELDGLDRPPVRPPRPLPSH
jgi:O-antigen ligase